MQADGYACTTDQLLDVLLAVSCQKDTIEQVSADLQIKVGAETIRGYFNEQLKVENLDNLQESVNLALQKSFSSDLKGQKLEIAIDFHDQSYYGKMAQAEGKWVGAEAKNGTTKVYRVATLYVIKNGHRLTLGIKFVVPDESSKEIVEYLLKQLKRMGIEARCLYLDRGFDGIEISRYLKEIKQTAIIACSIRGTTGGLRALCVGKKSYRTEHVFKSVKHGAEETEMAMFKGFTTTTKKGKKVRKAKWLAYILIECEANLSAKKGQRKLPKKIWNRSELPLCEESSGMDDQFKCGVSVCVNGYEFYLDEYLARITRKMDEKSSSWEKNVE